MDPRSPKELEKMLKKSLILAEEQPANRADRVGAIQLARIELMRARMDVNAWEMLLELFEDD